jgi:signal transduction histidine kinase
MAGLAELLARAKTALQAESVAVYGCHHTKPDHLLAVCGDPLPDAAASLRLPIGSEAYLLVAAPRLPLSAEQISALAEGFAAACEAILAHERAAAALAEAETQRLTFTRIVTHELRAPVIAMQSLLRAYLGTLKDSTDQQRDLLNRLSRRAEGLLALINDLLSLAAARADAKQQPSIPVRLLPLLEITYDHYFDQAREKHLHFSLHADADLSALATESAVMRILDNLIGNAVKYTPEGGSVRVLLAANTPHAEISVRDTGIGIPAAALGQLGEAFYRAPNAKAAGILGTGLGLATVKQLIAQYGGTLQVQSEVGNGSTFTVRLPLA